MSSASKIRKSKGDHMWFRSGKELKRTDKCRGLHFYNSVNRRKIKRLSPQEQQEVEEALDPYFWENYCINCDNFPGDNLYPASDIAFTTCPRKGQINAMTNWRLFNCPKFYN